MVGAGEGDWDLADNVPDYVQDQRLDRKLQLQRVGGNQLEPAVQECLVLEKAITKCQNIV